ncbi:two-component response regulator ORR24-like [Coffea eugenioides]|uniref:two-component response regulator ORR24-like n=1 Tax=Coffea eugenioides TaxID=49369 RepID=UPI000F612B35|nr:two-component response regulator ORR24-like [Coffea eugenioides]
MDVSSPGGGLIPKAAKGLQILLVDDDTDCLANMSSVLREHSYEVTTTKWAIIALSLIRQRRSFFDLVITEMDMPGFGGFTMLNQILLIKKDIPVILMSSNRDADMAKKALDEGACFFFFKPVHTPDLITVWQHVFRKRGNRKGLLKEVEDNGDRTVQTERPSGVNEENVADQPLIRDPRKGKAPCSDDGHGSKRPKNVGDDARQANKDKLIIGGNDKQARDKDVGKRKKMEKRKKRKYRKKSSRSAEKQPRLVWTPELHEIFLNAIAALGERDAHPTAIQKEMDIPELSHRHIASHLQKHRKHINKAREVLVRNPPIFEPNVSRYPSLSERKKPSFFESNMTRYLTPQPTTMRTRKVPSIFDTLMGTNPTEHSQSPYTPSFAPSQFTHPKTYLSEGTAYNQMDALNQLLANPSNNPPMTSNHQNSYANFGNQESSQLNHVQYSADQGKGKQVLSSFGGYNDNHVAPADDLCKTNVDALIEAIKKELADALGADANLRQDMKFLARYNNVVPQQSSHQTPSEVFSAACKDLLAPAETDFDIGEQMTYTYKDLAMILNDLNAGSEGISGSSSDQEPPMEFSTACEDLAPAETDFDIGEQMTYRFEDVAMILDDSSVGNGDKTGSSSESPDPPLPDNVADDDHDFTERLNIEDFSELFEIFPDIQDGAP